MCELKRNACQKSTRYRVIYCVLVSLILFYQVSIRAELQLFDTHLHYSQDVWQALPAEMAMNLLKSHGIQRAMLSSTPTEGVERLYRLDPQRILPMLRPYRNWRHRFTWFNDPELADYLDHHLKQLPYIGFGEFHVFGDDMASSGVRTIIALAKSRNMLLHAHTDLLGIQLLVQQSDSNQVVIWAHGGFDVPIEELENLLQQNPQFYIELSFREGMLDAEKRLTVAWYRLLTSYSERFLIGMDTYKPSRWAELPELVADARHWLAQLPEVAANRIAYLNAQRIVESTQQ